MQIVVVVLYQIDQSGGDQMRNMADCRHDPVMLPVIKYNMLCAAVVNTVQHQVQRIRVRIVRGSQHIPGILQKMSAGVFIPAFFGTRHGMAADELSGQPQTFCCFMNLRLGASYIGDQTVAADYFLQHGKISDIVFNRCT